LEDHAVEHPSDFDKWTDVTSGIVEHDCGAVISDFAHPLKFISLAEKRGAVDPPPYLLGNHTPARYAIRIWNYYSKL
jgi:hypothetical protein